MKKSSSSLPEDIEKYHKALSTVDKEICDTLAEEIARNLPKAENKLWHGHPVWFLDGNPIVGYDKLKDSVRLLFWSGQSFKEKDLKKEGSFKAAEIRYTEVAHINTKDLKRWLKLAQEIQWDYKNIVKRKGVLKKIMTNIKPDVGTKHRIYTMSVAKVYPLYVTKVEKKGRTKAEVDEIIRWLTGYTQKGLETELKKETDFETFFAKALKLNPARALIKGKICGVQIEEITDPLMREVRYLDKLIDELAKGRPMEKILRK